MNNLELLLAVIKKGLKVGVIDIETSPPLSYNYGYWGVNISHKNIILPSQITSLAYMDVKTRKVVVDRWDSPKPNDYKDIYKNNTKDKALLARHIDVLNSFDVLIGQNIRKFDWPTLQWRLNVLKLTPLNNIEMIDTLSESRKVFRPESHKLDYKSTVYGLGGKIKQDMEDIIAVTEGNVAKEKIRLIYNKKDVKDNFEQLLWEINSYKLPRLLIRRFKIYLKYDQPTFCVVCAANKQAKFDVVRRNKGNGEIKFQCNSCDSVWSINA